MKVGPFKKNTQEAKDKHKKNNDFWSKIEAKPKQKLRETALSTKFA